MSEQATLRDTLEEAVETVEEQHSTTPEAAPAAAAPAEGETQAQADARARDEKGRFATKGEPEQRPAAAAKGDPMQAATPPASPAATRPSSWRKEYWEKFDTLDPDLQKYILQREGEFSRGVSTYKAEAERAKDIMEAIGPHLQDWERQGVQPRQMIRELVDAQRVLSSGSPAERVAMVRQVMQNFGVTPEALLGGYAPQGYGQPQYGQPAVDPTQQWMIEQVQQLRGTLQQYQDQQRQQEQAAVQAEISRFAPQAEHLNEVRETMARLLESGLADNLESAYDKALRYHDDIWQAVQDKRSAEAAARKAAEQKQVVQRAKSAAVSTRGSSPTGTMSTGDTRKGIRDTLAENFDSVGGGRV